MDDDAARQSDPIVQVHADMEVLLRDAGLRPVVLRSDTLASNVRGWTAQLRVGDVIAGVDTARTAVVDESDVADAAAAVLLAPHHAQRAPAPYLLTGPEVLGRADQVARLGDALGRRLSFTALPAGPARSRPVPHARGRPSRAVGGGADRRLGAPTGVEARHRSRRAADRPPGPHVRAMGHRPCR
ncbi:hypothetical protein [Streptomyces sp. SID8352]|uniref:hypothetical protein n=1 Tax=Streptomyces sp. SID8352 TaxID=2690338 RepID=UPI001F267BB8|nr:hypothetical protein [Streptomyces sp. SID8352]